jgi:hypothetical protein
MGRYPVGLVSDRIGCLSVNPAPGARNPLCRILTLFDIMATLQNCPNFG